MTPTHPLGAQVLEFQSDAVDSAAVAEAWLNSLPLTVDEVEAQGSHGLLVRLIEQSDPRCSCNTRASSPPFLCVWHCLAAVCKSCRRARVSALDADADVSRMSGPH